MRINKQNPVRLISLICLSLFFASTLYAGGLDESIRDLEKELFQLKKGKTDKKWAEEYQYFNKAEQAAQFLYNTEQELNRLSFSVSVGYNIDRARADGPNATDPVTETTVSKLTIGTEVQKGVYPRQMRFKLGSQITFKGNDLIEEVTALAVSYDHHFNRFIEVYGFAERFTDSYLSLKNRYEIGIGTKFEAEFGLSKPAKSKMKTYQENARIMQWFIDNLEEKNGKTGKDTSKKCMPDSLSDEQKELQAELEKIKKDIGDKKLDGKGIVKILKAVKGYKNKKQTLRAFKKRYGLLSLGMAATVLSELEKAEIESPVNYTPVGGQEEELETQTFPVPATHQFRFVLRPSLVFRPYDSVSLAVQYYHKFPLGRGSKRADYRNDLLIQAKYDMPSGIPWAKKIAVVFEYRRQYDNMPPQIPDDDRTTYLSEYTLPAGKDLFGELTLGKPIAAKSHEVFQCTLQIAF